MIPKPVQDYVNNQGGGEINALDPKDLLFNGFICIPGHSYDLHESNIYTHLINLTKVGAVNLLKAPYCDFWKKTDPNQPAYVICSAYMDELGYHWAEF